MFIRDILAAYCVAMACSLNLDVISDIPRGLLTAQTANIPGNDLSKAESCSRAAMQLERSGLPKSGMRVAKEVRYIFKMQRA